MLNNLESCRKYSGLVVVIPTRNRASYAIRAISSVLDQAAENVFVLISDNSTKPKDSCDLSDYCRKNEHRQVRYIAPPRPLPISSHWEWAIREALRTYDANHFLYLSDRNVFLPNGLVEILINSAVYPDKVISYNHNIVDDSNIPVRLFQNDWTGALYELKSMHMFYLASRLKTHMSFPLMTNCIVPRSILDNIRNHFGRIFDSLSPDYYFAFRCLDVVDSIAYFDKPVYIAYGLNKSSGWSHTIGIPNEAELDYLSYIEGRFSYFAAPMPELVISANAKVHEYCMFERQKKDPKYPKIDVLEYLKVMESAVALIRDPGFRFDQKEILEKYKEANSRYICVGRQKNSSSSNNHDPFIQRMRRLLRKRCFMALWYLLSCLVGIYPSGFSFEFNSSAEAIRYANKFPRRKRANAKFLRDDLELANLKALRTRNYLSCQRILS